jgi:hypothetical protein
MWNISAVWAARQQMMQDVHVTLNTGLSLKNQHSAEGRFYS